LISPASSRPACAHDQSAIGRHQRLVCRPEANLRGGDVGLLRLRGERIRGAGGEHEVVGLENVTRGQRHAASVDVDSAIAHEAAVGEQVLVGEEDPVQPLWLDERAPRRDVVDECFGGVDERDVGDVVHRSAPGVFRVLRVDRPRQGADARPRADLALGARAPRRDVAGPGRPAVSGTPAGTPALSRMAAGEVFRDAAPT